MDLHAMLPSWRATAIAGRLTLVPPGGRAIGAIEIREEVAPLVELAELTARALARAACRLDEVRLVDAQRFATDEGERAALLRIAGVDREAGCAIELAHGAVFGDHTYQRYDAVILDAARGPEIRAALDQLMRAARLGLGELRWRRFEYEPPPGWRASASGLTAEWSPDDGRARLIVPPARSANDPSVFEQLRLGAPREVEMERREGPVAVASPHGLRGTAWRAIGARHGARWIAHTVELFDTRYAYRVQLVSEADPAAPPGDRDDPFPGLVDRVAASIRPIPAPRAPRVCDLDMLAHWAS
ncbi:MAG: hypothetical protein K8W52_17005 [Deltaproteobacteria bacterium]|nr:hypothetical protein [Deltaproteobacteria bacterium]